MYKSCIDQGPSNRAPAGWRQCGTKAAARHRGQGQGQHSRRRETHRSSSPLQIPHRLGSSRPPKVTSIPFRERSGCRSLLIFSSRFLPSWLGWRFPRLFPSVRFLVRGSATSPESPVTGWIASLLGPGATHRDAAASPPDRGECRGLAGVSSKTLRAWVAWEMAALLPCVRERG